MSNYRCTWRDKPTLSESLDNYPYGFDFFQVFVNDIVLGNHNHLQIPALFKWIKIDTFSTMLSHRSFADMIQNINWEEESCLTASHLSITVLPLAAVKIRQRRAASYELLRVFRSDFSPEDALARRIYSTRQSFWSDLTSIIPEKPNI